MAVVAAGAAFGIADLKMAAAPELDREVSARGLWRRMEGRAGEVCLGQRQARLGVRPELLFGHPAAQVRRGIAGRCRWCRAAGDRVALEPTREQPAKR